MRYLKSFFWSVVALGVRTASAANAPTILPTDGGKNACGKEDLTKLIQNGQMTFEYIPCYLGQILKFCLQVSGVIAVLMVALAGYYMALGSADDKSKGKTILFYTAIGLFLIAMAWFIVDAFIYLLTTDELT